MRIDDRLLTVFAMPGDAPVVRASQWRQLVDILAQVSGEGDRKAEGNSDVVDAALAQLPQLAGALDDAAREGAIRALAGRLRFPALVRVLAMDSPRSCAAAMAAARLSDEEWAALIPELPSRARGFLRNRSDLGEAARAMLAQWVSADFRLSDDRQVAQEEAAQEDEAQAAPEQVAPDAGWPASFHPVPIQPAPVAPAPFALEPLPHASFHADAASPDAPAVAPSTISELVARIERYREERSPMEAQSMPQGSDALELALPPVSKFAFLTDDGGTIIEISGLPRGAVVGTSVADPAFDEGPGPDAYTAAAFRQRMPIAHGRMRLCGASMVDGDWRIEAQPLFDPESGRFRGYRGVMRRPTAAEDARPETAMAGQGRGRGDHIQELVHELRTPLGAIIGFAEIIEQQLFGPVSSPYRDLAATILDDARRLLAGFDDLHAAVRVERQQDMLEPGTTDPEWLVMRLADRLQTLTDERKVVLNITTADPLREFAMEGEQIERIYTRLLSAIIMAADPGEELDATLKTRLGAASQNCLLLSLPGKLADFEEKELLDAGNDILADSSDVPLLGLGFSLRLVRNLARNAGGGLRFHNGYVVLTLPALGSPRYGERDR